MEQEGLSASIERKGWLASIGNANMLGWKHALRLKVSSCFVRARVR